MKRFFFANLGWKLLSVVLALLLWISVASEPELSASVSVPILFRNVPGDIDVASGVPDRVNVEIRGPAGRLTQTNLTQAAVVLNLQDLQPGERTFTIGESSVRGLPMGVMFYRAVPSQVSLRFEHLLSKKVTIEPTYGKIPQEGFKVVHYSFDPALVTIRGPERRIQNIEHVTTDPIDLSGITGTSVMQVRVRLPDPQVRLGAQSSVAFHVTLEKIPNKEAK